MSIGRHKSLEEFAGAVSRETFLRLERFDDVFVKWAQTINLVAPSTIPDMWQRHILDSAQLAPLAPAALRWLDLGSGGGFPGAVMAILLCDRVGGHIDLVESNRKKASFLRTALAQANTPATVHSVRIEQSWSVVHKPEIVTARALAPMAQLLRLAEPWLTGGSRGLFHKGREYRREIEECAHLWVYDLVEHPSRVNPDSVILDVQNLRRR